MAQVLVRSLESDVVARLKRNAEARAISLEAYLRLILIDAARPSREDLLVEIDAIRARSRPGALSAAGKGSDLIRNAREASPASRRLLET